MTNLKDKLSASVRQAKTSVQLPSPTAVRAPTKRGGAQASAAAARPNADRPAAKTAATTPKQVQPAPGASVGFSFPDRVWPD